VEVQREITDFCIGRWIAAHCINGRGGLVFRRYFKGKPLSITGTRGLQELLEEMGFQVRAIYATANKYRLLDSIEETRTLSNVIRCTPTWDIDSTLQNWSKTVKVAKHIIAFLEENGIHDSVYIKWSGNGCHIHIHEEAFSDEILGRVHPLDLAYAIVEYVNLNVMPKISETEDVRIENRMDAGRVFTCPLSLHRELDVVCVCLKPNELDSFSPEWIKPGNFRHNPDWRRFRRGEADELALKAYEVIGGYPIYTLKGRKRRKSFDQQIIEWLRKE
jgi:hypothetical protein